MEITTLLRGEGLEVNDVAVRFHVSNRPRLDQILPWLADERPDLFDAFQNQHGPQAEAVLKRRRYLCSFVTSHGADYVFAGLYENRGSRFRTMEEFDADPLRIELQRLCDEDTFVERGRQKREAGRLEFQLEPMTALVDLIGRLRVAKPSGRAYARLAENLDCPVIEITRKRQLTPPPPEWRDFIVTADELQRLPRGHALRLAGWRGVYLITDDRDGARYVGSACGAENLLARWRAHVAREKGVTAELGHRDTGSFRFSILQLLLHDADEAEVLALEANWKARLHTREWGLNRN